MKEKDKKGKKMNLDKIIDDYKLRKIEEFKNDIMKPAQLLRVIKTLLLQLKNEGFTIQDIYNFLNEEFKINKGCEEKKERLKYDTLQKWCKRNCNNDNILIEKGKVGVMRNYENVAQKSTQNNSKNDVDNNLTNTNKELKDDLKKDVIIDKKNDSVGGSQVDKKDLDLNKFNDVLNAYKAK